MQPQEDNYSPQAMIIYVNPLDPSRPLQYGTIPQDANLFKIYLLKMIFGFVSPPSK